MFTVQPGNPFPKHASVQDLRDGIVVRVMESRGSGFTSGQCRNLVQIFCPTCSHMANPAMMSILTVRCQREDETAMERTEDQQSEGRGQKMKSLTQLFMTA